LILQIDIDNSNQVKRRRGLRREKRRGWESREVGKVSSLFFNHVFGIVAV
jgi:hypothetical protein